MDYPKVTNDEWRNLYDMAIRFRDLKPWNIVSGAEIFAVQNPEDGEIAYCSIMGELGQVYALAAYVGQEGLETYFEMENSAEEGNPEALFSQKCLMVSFENREYVDKQDIKVIRELEYKFRGKNQWPVFRSLEPGYVPWFLNSYQARFLTVILEQALEVALGSITNGYNIMQDEDTCIMRIPDARGDSVTWENSITKLELNEKDTYIPVYNDEIKLRGLMKKIKSRNGIWAMDWFYCPQPVGEGEKPYFPAVMYLIECETGQIINYELTQKDNLMEKFQNKFIETIEKFNSIPQQVIVSREELYLTFEGLGDTLGIDFEVTDNTILFEEVKDSMYDFFSNV